MRRLTDHQLAHLGLRLVLGINIFVHGAVRLPKLASFADKTSSLFAETFLPVEAVYPLALAIPIIELTVGGLMLVGLKLRWALFGGLLLMAMLTFGTCLREQWGTAGSQLVYALVFWVLLSYVEHARLTVDRWRGRSPDASSDAG